MDTITEHYLICALWSSTNEDGTPLDRDYFIEDIAPEAIKKTEDDILAFIEKIQHIEHDLSDEQLGHDFWLTRNGHGAGFWDRGLGVIGDILTQKAHSFGEADLYVGDDGKLYIA